MKPRVAVVTPLFPIRESRHRGQPIYFTVRELQQWADVRVFCPVAIYPESRWLQPRSYKYRRPDLTWSPDDVPAEYFAYYTVPVVGRLFNVESTRRALLPRLTAWKPGLVLGYWVYPEGRAALLAGRHLRVPVVLGSRGSDLRRPPDRWSEERMQRTVREVDLLLTVSEELRRIALGYGADPNHVRTVANGVDGSLFHWRDRSAARAKLGFTPEEEVILYVGNLIATKGLNELVEAFLALASRRSNLRLVCVGEGSLRPPLEQKITAAGLGQSVRFPGVQPASEVGHWMAAANVLCLPSYSEGCPNVVLEALACGRAVVATAVGGTPEWIDGTNGLLMPPRDASALAAALEKAISRTWDEPALARRFKRSWQDVAGETWAACQSLLPGNQP